jgi:hypothetical protein
MTFAPRSFKKMFSENLRDIASWRALVIPLAVFLPILLNHPSESIGVIWHLVTSPFAWVIYLLLFVFDALIRAAYWHIRERNPNYIKKMEAYERKKQSLQTGVTEERGHS